MGSYYGHPKVFVNDLLVENELYFMLKRSWDTFVCICICMFLQIHRIFFLHKYKQTLTAYEMEVSFYSNVKFLRYPCFSRKK